VSLHSVPAACQIDRPILSNLYHRPTSNPGTGVPGFEGRQTRKPGFKKVPPGFAFPSLFIATGSIGDALVSSGVLGCL